MISAREIPINWAPSTIEVLAPSAFNVADSAALARNIRPIVKPPINRTAIPAMSPNTPSAIASGLISCCPFARACLTLPPPAIPNLEIGSTFATSLRTRVSLAAPPRIFTAVPV